MATVGGYHLFALSCATSIREYSESISYSRVTNDLGGGYRSGLLLGSENGERRFRIQMPTLAALSVLPNTVTGINGDTLSREEYVWELYCQTQITNTPFVIQSQRDGQYFLVDFVDESLSYERMRVKIYSTGLELRQRRIRGVSVWSWGGIAYVAADFNASPTSTWTDGVSWISENLSTDLQEFAITGNVDDSGTQNGLRTIQFNVGATNTGFLAAVPVETSIKEAFFVMKMREATFSNDCGIFTGTTGGGPKPLVGDSGTTKFTDFGLSPSNFEYRLNGIQYVGSDMQAPMNEWGIVHVRYTPGFVYTGGEGIQIGKDAATAGTFAEVDIAQMTFLETLLPLTYRRQFMEHLATTWSISLT